jgi:uncharacterized protein (DUF2062 family)
MKGISIKTHISALYYKKYNELYENLKQLCLKTDPKKTALALTLGISIGIIPVIGFTFIIVSLVGFAFRLNQVILQTAHLLVSPFQILFVPVFLMAGQYFFGSSEPALIPDAGNFVPLGFFQMINQFGHLIVYGLIIWLLFSVIFGYILYRFLLIILLNKINTKSVG